MLFVSIICYLCCKAASCQLLVKEYSTLFYLNKTNESYQTHGDNFIKSEPTF